MDIELWKILATIILAVIGIFVWVKITNYKKNTNSNNKTHTKVTMKVKENDGVMIWNINSWK